MDVCYGGRPDSPWSDGVLGVPSIPSPSPVRPDFSPKNAKYKDKPPDLAMEYLIR